MTIETFISLTNALNEFGEYYPTVKELGFGKSSYVDYKAYIDAFIKKYPKFEGRLLVLYGQRTFLKNRVAFFDECECPNPDNTMQNFCILTKDNLVVYLNARAFDTKRAGYFEILALEYVASEWLVMADNLGSIEHLSQLDYNLSDVTKEWNLNTDFKLSEEEIQDRIFKNYVEGRMCYRQVRYDISNQHIIFNGTERNNPYIKKMNVVYKDKFSSMESSKKINEEPVKQTEPTPFSLVGKYFHMFGKNKQVVLQGVVVSIITDKYAFVQYFDWVLGRESTMEIIPINVMAAGATLNDCAHHSFQFYDTIEQMQYWYRNNRPGVGI